VADVVATGARRPTPIRVMSLKPLAERKISADQVIARLRHELGPVPGATLFLQAVQDIRIGGRLSNCAISIYVQSETSRISTAGAENPDGLARRSRNSPTSIAISRTRGSRTELVSKTGHRVASSASTPARSTTRFMMRSPASVSTIYQCAQSISRGNGGGAAFLAALRQYAQRPFVSTSGGSSGGVQANHAVAGT